MKEHIEILLEELGEAKCQLFDVREIKEWQNSQLKQATLQPLSFLKKGLSLSIKQIKKKKPIPIVARGIRVSFSICFVKGESIGFNWSYPWYQKE